MKFKKVEIQAFRAYQKVENGTFDFEIEVNNLKNTADFVSIYAPNGFGKTSFYDAVEYGITNSIDRFLKNKLPGEIAKNERALGKRKGGQKILRNKYVTDANINSEVRLYTSNQDVPIVRTVPKLKRKDSTDFHFNKKLVENEYFQSVILSQEWIDAFLKVDDPKERYEKFMNFFGDTETSEYYKNVVLLISHNEEKIKKLNKDLEEKQLELNFDGDKEIVKKVNGKIRELNASGESLIQIDESYTKEDGIVLDNTVTERALILESDKISKDKRIQLIDNLFSGSETHTSVDTYYYSKSKDAKHRKFLEELIKTLKKFNQKQKYETEKLGLDKQQQAFLKKEEHLKELLKSFNSYEKIKFDIQKNESEIEKSNSNLDLAKKSIKDVQLSVVRSKTELYQKQQQVDELKAQLEKARKVQDKTKKDQARHTNLKNSLDKLKNQIEKTQNGKQSLELEINAYERALEKLDNNTYPSAYDLEFTAHKELIQEIDNLQRKLKEKEDDLKQLNKNINGQEELLMDIETFIANGSEIATKIQSSTCPLCSHKYDSFSQLAERITNNKLLSKGLSDLLKSRSEIETKISELTQSLKTKTGSLRRITEQIISDKKKIEVALQKELNTNYDSIQLLGKEYELLQGEIDDFKKLINNQSFNKFEKNMIDRMKTIETELKKLNDELIKGQNDLNKLLSDKENNTRTVEILKRTIVELRQDKNFQEVIHFFQIEFPAQEITRERLSEKAIETSDGIKKIISDRKENDTKLKELNELLKNTTEEHTQYKIKETEDKLEKLQKVLITFERELETHFALIINKLDKNTLTRELESIKIKHLEEIKSIEQKILDFNILRKQKQEVEPYLKYNEAQKQAAEIRGEKELLENKIKPLLEQEKQNVSEYLNNQVRSFFYEGLINDLYQRIDPHPDYKRISFACDFTEDKPKLNVCLYQNNKNDDPIIPNLYFSTAQLNILSLSIFLAKALNAKDKYGNALDCIFIDDPIQSMDSINILSTIDLFRSIVVNMEKQIILSTHDENFHNLLQKKMPSGLFKSKFMELETFGKVKRDTQLN